MCVIIVKGSKKAKISNDILASSAAINPHGLGVVWLDSYELEYFESKEFSVLDTNRPFIAHFRYATVGGVTKENIHPFLIRENKYLFQNGSNYNLGNKNITDTEHLANLLAGCDEDVWQDILEMTDSRYLTVDLKEKYYDIHNELLWYKKDGVLYSKNNVLDKTLVAVYGTLKLNQHNNKAFLFDSTYLGSGETLEKYPMIIDGLPYVLSRAGDGYNVDVDVFLVDKDTLEELDLLEGHPDWYKRELTEIILDNGTIVKAWLYFNDTIEDSGKYHKTFGKSNNIGYDSYNEFDEDPRNYYNDVMCPNCGSHITEYDEYSREEYCFTCGEYF